ncbi:MAG: helix-turn-helix domain-containing protein [Patescibacteria group bacterium]
MLEKYLEELGFSDKEATVYLALLQFDNASPAQIAEKTRLNRSTVYVVLESLEKKGLASETNVGKTVHYQAAAPERLETFVEQQQLKLEEMGRRLKDIIPQIKSVGREFGERPVVKFLDGKDAALKNNLDFFESYDQKGTAYFFFNRDLIEEIFTPKELEAVQKIRPKKTIRGKSIYVSSQTILPSNELTERKKVDKDKYPVTCDMSIYEDRVQIVTLGKSVSTIYIKSRDVAETLKSLFRLAFENLK